LISPNINYERPRKGLKGVHAGRIKIVVDPTPFQDENGLVGKFFFLLTFVVLKERNYRPNGAIVPYFSCVTE